jgi:hypothetical protein
MPLSSTRYTPDALLLLPAAAAVQSLLQEQ